MQTLWQDIIEKGKWALIGARSMRYLVTWWRDTAASGSDVQGSGSLNVPKQSVQGGNLDRAEGGPPEQDPANIGEDSQSVISGLCCCLVSETGTFSQNLRAPALVRREYLRN